MGHSRRYRRRNPASPMLGPARPTRCAVARAVLPIDTRVTPASIGAITDPPAEYRRRVRSRHSGLQFSRVKAGALPPTTAA